MIQIQILGHDTTGSYIKIELITLLKLIDFLKSPNIKTNKLPILNKSKSNLSSLVNLVVIAGITPSQFIWIILFTEDKIFLRN